MFQVKMSSVVEDINDKHMSPWAEACQRDRIVSTPLNPFLDEVRTPEGIRLYSTVNTNHFITNIQT